MHLLTLQIQDGVFEKVISFLQTLPQNEIHIIEATESHAELIDLSQFKIPAINNIQDPVEWQKAIRSEW